MNKELNWDGKIRLGGLRRFAIGLSLLNLLGHMVFGFEQSWAQPLVAMAAAYSLELLVEMVDAWAWRRRPNFFGGPIAFIDFLLPAHITALAVSMLLYANDRLWVVAFATLAAIASKAIIKIRVGAATRHIFNPSNLGITLTLLLFPWVGIAQPYQFTENLHGPGDWILPAVIIPIGTFLNLRFTRKIPLIVAWLLGFAGQAAVRSLVFGTPMIAAVAPMTGVAFIVFTFYMITDPATSPSRFKGQVAFGLGVAAAYGALVALHAVFGLFFGLSLVCAIRWLGICVMRALSTKEQRPAVKPAAAALIGSDGVHAGAVLSK